MGLNDVPLRDELISHVGLGPGKTFGYLALNTGWWGTDGDWIVMGRSIVLTLNIFIRTHCSLWIIIRVHVSYVFFQVVTIRVRLEIEGLFITNEKT